MSSLVKPDRQTGGANETVALLKSLLEQLAPAGGADESGGIIAALVEKLNAVRTESNSTAEGASKAPNGNAVAVGKTNPAAEPQAKLTQIQVPEARNGAAENGFTSQASGDRNRAVSNPGVRVAEAQPVRNPQSPASAVVVDEVESEANPAPVRTLTNSSKAAETSTRVPRGAQPEQTPNSGRAAIDSVVEDPRVQSRDKATTAAPARPQAAVRVEAPVMERQVVDRPAEIPAIQSDLATADRPISAPTGFQTGALQASSQSVQLDSAPAVQQRPDVAAQIVRAAQITIERGGGTVRLQLEPPELGRINLSLKITDGGMVTMHIVSDSAEARSIVQSQLGDLQTALQDRGFDVGTLSVSVKDQGESSARNDETSPDSDSDADFDVADGFEDPDDERRQLYRFGHDGFIDFSV